MPLCQVNVGKSGIGDALVVRACLQKACAQLHSAAPVIILVHGYKYSPSLVAHDPHSHIFALEPRPSWKSASWPRRLGLDKGSETEPLCVAFGWEARGTLWQAYQRAPFAGQYLATLISWIRDLRPSQPVHVLTHSLGGRVALSALPNLQPGAIGTMILLAAAEMKTEALACLATPAGQTASFVNVRSRENAVFDHMLEWLVAPYSIGDRAIGHGMDRAVPRWLDLAVDDPSTRAMLGAIGFDIPAPDKRVCHWSTYLRPGLFGLYRAILEGDLPLARLRASLPVAPRRPRSRGWLAPTAPLSLLRRGTS